MFKPSLNGCSMKLSALCKMLTEVHMLVHLTRARWREGDWLCSTCNNHNYASRAFCNRFYFVTSFCSNLLVKLDIHCLAQQIYIELNFVKQFTVLWGSPVHVVPVCAGSGEGYDHFGSYVCNLSLHFYKRLFPILEPHDLMVTRHQFYRCKFTIL
jgi:hypothetical protein